MDGVPDATRPSRDPLVDAWSRRSEINRGLFGLLTAIAIGAFLVGAWWWGVATKPWVREKIGDEREVTDKAAGTQMEKLENVRIDVGIIKSKVDSLERENDRTADKIQRLYEDLGALPAIQRARQRRESEEEQARPPRRPGHDP